MNALLELQKQMEIDFLKEHSYEQINDMFRELKTKLDEAENKIKKINLQNVSGTLPEFNSTKIIELAEENRNKCKNHEYDWSSYYNGFLDGFATYFNKYHNCR